MTTMNRWEVRIRRPGFAHWRVRHVDSQADAIQTLRDLGFSADSEYRDNVWPNQNESKD